ncbi:MAG: alpha/beta fold hydrolase [Actinomycetota bacterium]|nr:alpha/beta fold hydrolase [Actinomycetota bacterium]
MTDAKPLPGLTERFAEIKGCRMRYLVGGRSTGGRGPLILVHGLGGGAANWVELAPLLARRHRLLVPELPGHGGSSPLPAVPNLNVYADRIGLLAEREGLTPAAVVGHSLGGVVALRLALRRPAAVNAVVLAGSAGISSRAARARFVLEIMGIVRPARRLSRFRSQFATHPRLRVLPLGHWLTSDPEALSPRAVEGFLGPPALHTDTVSAARALFADDPWDDLAHVGSPCLVLWGARDHQLPVSDAFDFARGLAAPLRLISDCGHLLIGERPEACADAIEQFVS